MLEVALLDDLGHTWSALLPETRFERARGLRAGPELLPMQGMLFIRCRSVHTFGMRFPIRVAFIDARGSVRSVRTAPPGRFLLDLGAHSVFECAARARLKPGDRLIRVAPG